MKFYTLDNKLIKKHKNLRLDKDFTGYILYGKDQKDYFLNGARHRLGGPAFRCNNSQEYYYVFGIPRSKEEHDLLYNLMKLKGLI